MNYNLANVYQSVNQAQQMQNMNCFPINNIPNPMYNQMNYNNMNNPMDQILMMSMLFQNQNIPGLNMGGNQNYNNMNNNLNRMNSNNSKGSNKINLCFSTLKGARINMIFQENETVDGVLTKFLKRVNLDHMIGNVGGKLNFILSAENLKFGDNRLIKNLIMIPSNFTTIFVHDTQNLIGANKI